jgi:amino acid adenylation domain-containing protein
LTDEKFIPNPFSNEPEARLYKTGDLARYLPDGNIEFLGRIDEQVKIRGFRIELGEIQTVLGKHPAVRETLALVREDVPDDKRLVAYVVLKQEQSPSVGELRSFLKQKLPDYMVPTAFVILDALPLTPNGKVDLRQLPAPGTTRPELEEVYVPPRTPMEKVLAAVWAEVLGIQNVGIYDNFFSLGGDSIRTIQVIALAKERGLNFSLQQFFQHQTIYELAQELEVTELNTVSTPRTEPFSLLSEEDFRKLPVGIEDAYPMTMLQMGMIYHMELAPDILPYHNVDSFHIRTHFDFDAFQAAVQKVVNRHAVLRTSFDLTTYSQPMQLVHQKAFLPVHVEDLRKLSLSEQEKAITVFAKKEKNRSFDLSHPPLLRFHIHRLTEDTFQWMLTEHHAILDGWSLHSTLVEILNHYFALINNEISPTNLPPLTSFRDYVALELMALKSEEYKSYWIENLRGSTLTPLPYYPLLPRDIDISNPEISKIRSLEFIIPSQVCENIEKLARFNKLPFKSFLLAAHLKVISMLSGQSDIIVGLTLNGRPEEIDGTQVRGLFLNTLPLRLQLSSDTWIDLVKQTFEAETELMPFRHYPMAQIQKDLGRQSLFEVNFVYNHFHVVRDVLTNENLEFLNYRIGFDTELRIEPTNFVLVTGFLRDPLSSKILLCLDYDATRLSEKQVKSISGYYVRCLEAIASNPLAHHESQSLLCKQERYQLLVEWNNTTTDYPNNTCIHQLFEAQVERTPDAVAVVFEDQQLTYRELNYRANQLAHYLQTLGVGPEVLVGICVERSLEMVVGLLGILKAGGAYVPLDPAYPKKRLAFMLEDSQVSVLLTQEQLVAQLPKLGAHVVGLDTDWGIISQESQHNPFNGVKPENLAYVIYTSGSTGKPKGTMIVHQGLVNYLSWCTKTYAVADGCGAPVHSSIGFDATITSLFSPLLVGQRVVLLPEKQEIEFLSAALRSQSNFSLVKITPAHLELLNQLLPTKGAAGQTQALIIGGEALSGKSLSFWQIHASEIRIINEYGPTETVVGCCVYEVPAGASMSGAVPIGRPIANTQIYILDPHLQPVPIGVPGELHIGGAGLAQGYLNRPELTAEKFIPNPFSDEPGSRLYKTGDLARYLPDGNIEYIGRLDNQVKLRGFRIELGEIETVLSQHPDVLQTVVIAREDHPSDKRLVAYVVPTQEQALSINELRCFLKEKLPEYMVPAAFVLLDALPLTPNGKVDRHALPVPEQGRPELEGTFVAPRTPGEQQIADIWTQVLGLERVGVHDNFFELGGNSLLVIQVISRLRKVFQVALPLGNLFEAPTVAELTERVETLRWAVQALQATSSATVNDHKEIEL